MSPTVSRFRDSLDWLTAHPVAHRGLHDRTRGIIENTASAFRAAVADGYGIECDLQRSADGEAMVFHDFTLDRLTEARGPVAALDAGVLARIPMKGTGDRILCLTELFDLVAGRVPLVIELKSDFSGDTRLAARAAELIRAYDGPAALMSFDPEMIAIVRHQAPEVPRGIVAEYAYDDAEWTGLSEARRFSLRWMLHWPTSRFQFVNYRVHDLDRLPPRLAHTLGLPLLAWTVRSSALLEDARRHGAQAVFEGLHP